MRQARCESTNSMGGAKGVEVTREEARRIAVRAQLLDGSATRVLDTVRRLGFLQLDPISTVAPPQYLVLWSRLGNYDRAELDRLLWEQRKLFEWDAFIWPIEDLPLLRARMRERWGHYKRERWALEFLKEQAGLRRYVLRELERRGPLPSRELEHDDARFHERTVWWGTRAQLTWMLELIKAKREYGYYVLPILADDDLGGRIEPVFDRKSRVLRVENVWWEPGKKEVPLDEPLRSLGAFVGADSIST
jgi:uncharacterized protein YcaQ